MKYVMMRIKMGKSVTRLVPIIFPEILAHSEVAEALQRTETLKDAEVASAGSIDLDDVTCSGRSDSLKVESKAHDELVIETIDYMHGIGFEEQG